MLNGLGLDEFAPMPLPSPVILWIELSSKCPFDCKFCSRRLLRGEGEHMDFQLYRSLISQLQSPQILRLNYSGESIHYPHLTEAIRLASRTGAWVELVTAFASIPERRISSLVGSGLDRLTVSLHTTDAGQYRQIYRFSDLDTLRRKLEKLQECKARGRVGKPELDFAFVAVRENLHQLPRVAAYARQIGARGVSVHPVLRRDPIPELFHLELRPDGGLSEPFRALLKEAVIQAQDAAPEVPVQVASPAVYGAACVGEKPAYYPEALPPGSRIHSCDQSPWETAHILVNGDVVACEVQDKQPLGNIRRQTLGEIWQGEAYRQFRERYVAGRDLRCCTCPWKMAYRPAPLHTAIVARDGANAQLLAGWHQVEKENGIVWSRGPSCLVLSTGVQGGHISMKGMLPPPMKHRRNTLEVRCDGQRLARVDNEGREHLFFLKIFQLPFSGKGPVQLSFIPKHLYWPARAADSPDCRSLGFALAEIAVVSHLSEKLCKKLDRLQSTIARVDSISARLRDRGLIRPRTPDLPSAGPGISVLIPERANPNLLRKCLWSVRNAAAFVTEPLETVVVVSGSSGDEYRPLVREFPAVRWRFVQRPLGFARSVGCALKLARYDWVYLLNNDMTLEPDALAEVLRWRGANVFAVASQIFFEDSSRRREETNWTDFRIADGLIEIFDVEPEDDRTVSGNFYAGGGSSLFRKRLLERVLPRTAIYEPFYWEDVEWSSVARRWGFEVLFCASSHVRHTHRATISKFYDPAEVDRIWRRNAALFQLRNLPVSAPLPAAFARIRKLEARSIREILKPGAVLRLLFFRAAQFSYRQDESCLYACRTRAYPQPDTPGRVTSIDLYESSAEVMMLRTRAINASRSAGANPAVGTDG